MTDYTTDQIRALITLEARRQGIDPRLALAVATQESYLNPNAVGDNGQSRGLFQLQRAAALDAGVDPQRRGEVLVNIRGGVRYLQQKLQQSDGNVPQALSRYNRGTPTYRGIGDPRYVEHVLGHYDRQQAPPRPGLVSRVVQAVSPARAEATPVRAERTPDVMPTQDEITTRLQQLRARQQQLQQQTAAPAAPPAGPAAAPAPAPAATPGVPTAATQVQLLGQQEAGRLAAERAVGSPTRPAPTLVELGKGAAATGISAGGAMLGTAAGTLAAPFTGPLAPAMPLVGEMAGSYAARRLNVGLGLEDPSVLGDVASVAVPGIFGLRGVVRGLRAGAVPGGAVPHGAEQLAQEAQERGVPLTYGEVAQQPVAQRTETLLEQVPVVGTAGFRRRQQQAVTQAAQAETLARQQALQQTPWQGLEEVRRLAQQGNRQAQQVLEQIDNAGEDWSRIVQTSGNLRAFRTRQAANRLYGAVDQLAEGLGAVPPERTLRVVDDVLTDLRGAVLPDQPTIQRLEQVRENLTTTPRTYRQMRQFDSDVGDIIRDYYSGSNAVVGSKGVGSFTRLRTALREDLDAFAQGSGVPELRAMQQRANRYYQQEVIPYEDAQVAKALRSDTPDEIYGAFIRRGHRDRAQKFYNALEPHGRAAVQYGMVAEALEKSLHPTTGQFSPAKFAGELERIQDARGVFFRGQEAWRLDGLARVMRAAERAGYFTENPPTGQRVIGAMLGTGAVMAPGTTAKVAATAAGLRWLLTSRGGSSLLLRAHRTAEDALGMEEIVRQIGAQGARVLATEAGEGLQEGTQVQVEPGRVGR